MHFMFATQIRTIGNETLIRLVLGYLCGMTFASRRERHTTYMQVLFAVATRSDRPLRSLSVVGERCRAWGESFRMWGKRDRRGVGYREGVWRREGDTIEIRAWRLGYVEGVCGSRSDTVGYADRYVRMVIR